MIVINRQSLSINLRLAADGTNSVLNVKQLLILLRCHPKLTSQRVTMMLRIHTIGMAFTIHPLVLTAALWYSRRRSR